MLLFGPRIKAALNPGSITGALDVETVTYIRSISSRTRRTQSALETHSPEVRNSWVNEERFSALRCMPTAIRCCFGLDLVWTWGLPGGPHETARLHQSSCRCDGYLATRRALPAGSDAGDRVS